jgi:predicted nucleotidyltransferase
MKDAMQQVRVIADRLKKEYKAQRVILFGSYATGKARRDSDVDLLIIAPTIERFYQRMATVKRLIRDLRNGLPIAPIVLTQKEIHGRIKKGDQFVIGILDEGVEL